jgi:hypothetical protein
MWPEYRSKEIFGQEDSSFDPAIADAVGWALPSVWEEIFNKSPNQPWITGL